MIKKKLALKKILIFIFTLIMIFSSFSIVSAEEETDFSVLIDTRLFQDNVIQNLNIIQNRQDKENIALGSMLFTTYAVQQNIEEEIKEKSILLNIFTDSDNKIKHNPYKKINSDVIPAGIWIVVISGAGIISFLAVTLYFKLKRKQAKSNVYNNNI